MSQMTTKNYHVEGLQCVSCAMLIENELEDTHLVDEAVCHYAQAKLTVKTRGELADENIARAVEKLGYKLGPYDTKHQSQ